MSLVVEFKTVQLGSSTPQPLLYGNYMMPMWVGLGTVVFGKIQE